jgi:hypothetical protein
MDSLEAMLAAQAPIVEAMDDPETDGPRAQANAGVLGDMTSAPLFPLDDHAKLDRASDAADGMIFAALVSV